jgi:hypothetical protein
VRKCLEGNKEYQDSYEINEMTYDFALKLVSYFQLLKQQKQQAQTKGSKNER